MSLHRAITISSYAIASSLLAPIASEIGLRKTLLSIAALTTMFLFWTAYSRRAQLDQIAAIEDGDSHITEADPLSEEFIVE